MKEKITGLAEAPHAVRVRLGSGTGDFFGTLAGVGVATAEFFLVRDVLGKALEGRLEEPIPTALFVVAWTAATLFFPLGLWWNHVSYVELDGDRIVCRRGRRTFEASLEDVTSLEKWMTEGLDDYVVLLRDGRRISFSEEFDGSMQLARLIEQRIGVSFTDNR